MSIPIEKQIAFRIRDQFPALYKEFGTELVDFVEEYYHFLEEDQNQTVYNNRRLYEYRDITQTLPALIAQFHKMFMADMPLKEDKDVRFIVKKILDLYRRKGTPGGILLFFRIFFQEDVEIRYPASKMLKVSDSDWRSGVFLQCFPNDNLFKDKDDNEYTYADLIGKNIRGSISKARAAVDKINFVLINNTLTPVIYVSDVKGNFIKYDDLLTTIGGNEVAFGVLNGSTSSINIDLDYGGAIENKIGDILNIDGTGQGGKVIVTDLEDEFTGTIDYKIEDSGYGYTVENTKLLVSSQSIILDNPDFAFTLEEKFTDSAGNVGTVIGQSAFAVGVYFAANNESFDIGRSIRATDRTGTPLIEAVTANTGSPTGISDKNSTSPGPLFPITGSNTDVKVAINNIQSVSLITDKIANFIAPDALHPGGLASTNIPFNSSNYNDSPPAGAAMSGNTDPITAATSLADAFNLTPFSIGAISELVNVNPGEDYTTDVWTLARDETMSAFDRFEQVISLDEVSAAMSRGDIVTQANTGINSNTTVTGIITNINSSESFIKVRPYSYYGFESSGGDIAHKGSNYGVSYVARDYDADKLGESADITSRTIFSSGRIKEAKIYESGLGYVDGETVFLTDNDGVIKARATISSASQGITSGYSASFNSHLNGYWTNPENNKFEYFQGGMKVQDSDYYQDYSYQIKGTVSRDVYEKPLKQIVHLAGTKLFSDFQHKRIMGFGPLEKGVGFRFNQIIKIDDTVGGDPIVGPDQVIAGDGGSLSVDTSEYTADSIVLSADATSEP